MDPKPAEDILKALDEIVDVNIEEVSRRRTRKRSSILKQPKSSDDGLSVEDMQNKRKSITSKRVSFADKFQVMEFCTETSYDVSGRSGSAPDSTISGNLISETKSEITEMENNAKISEVSRTDVQISMLTEKCEMKFEQHSFANIPRKHKTSSDEDLEPERKKFGASHNFDSSLYLHLENKFSTGINVESDNSFDRIFHTSANNYSEVGQNQGMKPSFINHDVQESSIFQEMLKVANPGMETEDLLHRTRSNSEETHRFQTENMPTKDKRKSEYSIFSSVIADKNTSSVDYLSKYRKGSSNMLNTKLYPVVSCNDSLQENKENIYVDLKNKSILVTNDRQLKLARGIPLQFSQSQQNYTVESQVSDIKKYDSEAFTRNIQQSVDSAENISSQDKIKNHLFDQQKNANSDKTCLLSASMDLTCLDLNTKNFDDSDISNKEDECFQSYQTSCEGYKSKMDIPKEFTVGNSLTAYKSKRPQENLNKTKLFVEDMDITCVGDDFSKNPISQYASFSDSDVVSEKGLSITENHSVPFSNLISKHVSSDELKNKTLCNAQKSETSIAKDCEKSVLPEHSISSHKLLKAETYIPISERRRKLDFNKTCFFDSSMDLTCLAPSRNKLNDSSDMLCEERVQNLKHYQTDNLPIDEISSASTNSQKEMGITSEINRETSFSVNNFKLSASCLDKTKLYPVDMDMTCCLDKGSCNDLIKQNSVNVDLNFVSKNSVDTEKQELIPDSNLTPSCVKHQSVFLSNLNSKKMPSVSVPEFLFKNTEKEDLTLNKSTFIESKTKLFPVDMDMTCCVGKESYKNLMEQNIMNTTNLGLVSESTDNVPKHETVPDSNFAFRCVKQHSVSHCDFKDIKKKDVSPSKSIFHETKTKLFPVDMDMTCVDKSSYESPSKQDSLNTDFDLVSEKSINALKQSAVHESNLFYGYVEQQSVPHSDGNSKKLSSTLMPKFLFKDVEGKDASSCKIPNETKYLEDQSICHSKSTLHKKYDNNENKNVLYSNHAPDDKPESFFTDIKSKVLHNDKLHENISFIKGKKYLLYAGHNGESSEGLKDLNFLQAEIHASIPKHGQKDFDKTNLSDNSMDMTCLVAHDKSDNNDVLKEDTIHSFIYNQNDNLNQGEKNVSEDKVFINEETTTAIPINRPKETVGQTKLPIENAAAIFSKELANQHRSAKLCSHVNSESDLKHDICAANEQRDNENVTSSNDIESNNKIVQSSKSTNAGIVYAIKQIKDRNQILSSDDNVLKFPEVFFSLRKQPKPNISFSCTKAQLSEALRSASKQSCGFNYGFKELSFTAETNKNPSSLPINEQDKLDEKETSVDPSVNFQFSNSVFIPEYSENIENFVKTDTTSVQEEALHLISSSILDNSFVRNDTNSVTFKFPPSLCENILNNNTSTKSKLEITVEKIITPQSIKKTIRLEEEKLHDNIFMDDVPHKATSNPVIVVTRSSNNNSSVADRAISDRGSVLKNTKATQTPFPSSVSAVPLHNVTSNSQKLRVSENIVDKNCKVPAEVVCEKLNRNLAPQFEQLSEVQSDLSLSDLNDEVFSLPSEATKCQTNVDGPYGNSVLNERLQSCEKEKSEVSDSKNISYLSTEKECVIDGNYQNQEKCMENSQSSTPMDIAEASDRSAEQSNIPYRSKIIKLNFLRKKFIEASEDEDCLWELREINESQAVFELNGYCMFACYSMHMPLGLESEVSPNERISFQHLKPEPDEIDELGLSLFHSRIMDETEVISFCGEMETICVSSEKLLHKISKYLDILSVAKSLIKDVTLVAIKNEISIDNSQELPRLIVKVLNQNTFSLFKLTFSLNLRTYPLEKIVPEVEYLEFSQIENEIIIGALDRIEPGTKYLFRMVEATHTL